MHKKQRLQREKNSEMPKMQRLLWMRIVEKGKNARNEKKKRVEVTQKNK